MSQPDSDTDIEQEGGDFPADSLSEGVRAGLAQLRDLTRRTGVIHEAQMLQLKYWPRILFPCTQHSIDYVNDQKVLTLTMRMTQVPTGDDLKVRVKKIQQWCWALLGDDWAVHLRYRLGKGGKTRELHHGRRRQALQKNAQPPVEYGLRATTEFKRYSHLDKASASVAASEQLPPLKG